MHLSRRTFMQACMTASVGVAAEAARTPWLLNGPDPIRVGIAGLGVASSEHLALYSAIPGARIEHIADPSPGSLDAALALLRELGHPMPRVSRCFVDLLADRTLHALSFPREVPAAGFSLERAMDAGLPVLTDVPPPSLSLPVNPRLRRAPIYLRIGDFCSPGAAGTLDVWSKRLASFESTGKPLNGDRTTIDLILQRGINRLETRAVMISALVALVRPRAVSASQMMAWASDPGAVEASYGSPTARINLPTIPGAAAKLNIELFPRAFRASTLFLKRRDGSLELPIWPRPDAQASLYTVIRFLDGVRCRAASSPEFDSAVASSQVIDRLLRKLHVDL